MCAHTTRTQRKHEALCICSHRPGLCEATAHLGTATTKSLSSAHCDSSNKSVEVRGLLVHSVSDNGMPVACRPSHGELDQVLRWNCGFAAQHMGGVLSMLHRSPPCLFCLIDECFTFVSISISHHTLTKDGMAIDYVISMPQVKRQREKELRERIARNMLMATEEEEEEPEEQNGGWGFLNNQDKSKAKPQINAKPAAPTNPYQPGYAIPEEEDPIEAMRLKNTTDESQVAILGVLFAVLLGIALFAGAPPPS